MEGRRAERTFIAVKPDGVQRGIIGEIIRRFERCGAKLVAGKFMLAPKELLREHYKEHAAEAYFDKLVEDVSSGPILAMVWEGSNAVRLGRKMLGVTDPSGSEPGTIRGDFCVDVKCTACHGSDSAEAAQREIALWFKSQELHQYELANSRWVYE